MRIIILFIVFLHIIKNESAKIIIVGAGASGIACYSRLMKNNITDILVLEAEPRIGGRINTVPFADSLVELGAEWVHGIKGNAAYKIARPFNILEHSTFDLKLQSSTLPDFSRRFSQELYNIHSEIYDEDGNIPVEAGVNMGDYYLKKYTETIYDKYGNNSRRLRLANYALGYFEMDISNTAGSNSWFDVSAKSNYRVTEGDLALSWKRGGYKSILSMMLDDFEDNRTPLPFYENLILNKEVDLIYWKDNRQNPNRVTVYTTDDDVYDADIVVFTPSLGVLQNSHDKLFWPKLDQWKQYAIYTLGFGTVGKCVMHFPKRWWPAKNFTGWGLVWTEETKKLMKDFPKGPSEHGESWILGVTGLYPIPNNPDVLIARMSGQLAKNIELLPDKMIIEGLMYVIERFFGHKYQVERPDSVVRSFWYSNPHFKGTYSYETVSSIVLMRNAQEELTRPLVNENNKKTVLFAGEATHPYYYSTVHGAIESGFREADRIINLIRKNKL